MAKSATLLDHDLGYMKHALTLAKRGQGITAPNPSVGCIIVKDSVIVGRGTTSKGGRPHAEANALAQAGNKACGATAYVTLEPCAHQGQSGPCAKALVSADLSRVVIGSIDPNPHVSGKGIEILKTAGIDVNVGVLAEETDKYHQGFFLSIAGIRPHYTLKIASSLDGKTATGGGESKWITSAQSREFGHMLRATHDAIMIGAGTAIADNPMLDCRLNGISHQSPIRIVMDRALRTPIENHLFSTANTYKTYIITEAVSANKHPDINYIKVNNINDLHEVSNKLIKLGITSVLVEGGATLHGSFFKANLADEIYWLRSQQIIGDEGLSAIGALELAHLSDANKYELKEIRQIGPDLLERRARKG